MRKTYNMKTSFMVTVFPGLSLNDRAGCEILSTFPIRRFHSTSKILLLALLVTWITVKDEVRSVCSDQMDRMFFHICLLRKIGVCLLLTMKRPVDSKVFGTPCPLLFARAKKKKKLVNF